MQGSIVYLPGAGMWRDVFTKLEKVGSLSDVRWRSHDLSRYVCDVDAKPSCLVIIENQKRVCIIMAILIMTGQLHAGSASTTSRSVDRSVYHTDRL